ncbi:MAG: LytTR family transcriptional regulator [bacterium]|nr:LytTR family transcriptional regulator [bacterium]
MMILKSFLTKPHPFIFNWSSIVIPGLVTFFVVSVFQPFGLNSLESYLILKISVFLMVLVSAVVSVMVPLMQKLFPTWMDKEEWTLGKEVLQIIVVLTVITFMIFLSVNLFLETSISQWSLFTIILLKTLSVSILPILLMVLFEQYMHNRKKLNEAIKLTKELEQTGQPEVSRVIKLFAENGKLALQMETNELVYMQSDGNYVDVFQLNQGKLEKSIVRNRLKSLLELLPEEEFFHCHKRYLINGHHVLKVEGNARNLELSMRGVEKKIPVSRANNEAVKSFLASLSR